jgi:hypothetical protein
MSGRSTQNAGWPYFDVTYREYPAFKRKFLLFQANYHQGTSTRKLVLQFREMCLPDKIAVRIKKAESMEVAWRLLDALYNDPMAFIKDLMQEIRGISTIKDGEDECLMDYYMLLQYHMKEAAKAGLACMLLIPANVKEMVGPLYN